MAGMPLKKVLVALAVPSGGEATRVTLELKEGKVLLMDLK
jgi:hypothetical protein